MTTTFVLIDHNNPSQHQGGRFAAQNRWPLYRLTCGLKRNGVDGRTVRPRLISAFYADILFWLEDQGIQFRRGRCGYRYRFDLDANQEVEFRMRWG